MNIYKSILINSKILLLIFTVSVKVYKTSETLSKQLFKFHILL